MKHCYRFIGANVDGSNLWRLDEEESRHLEKVLRLKLGDAVEVTDMNGTLAIGKVERLGKEVEVLADSTEKSVREGHRRILILGALKPKDLDDVIPGLVEAGLDKVIVFGQGEDYRLKSASRWERIVVSSLKQSKRLFKMELEVASELREAVTDLGNFPVKLVLDPDGVRWSTESLRQSCALLVGGEKGFRDSEIEVYQDAGFLPVSLGPNIYRARTAAVIAAGLAGLSAKS